jgi:penicillin V acylase-like amidase (Ntn superfamily)
LLLAGLQAAPSPACTSFCLDTPGGPFFGTNLDLSFDDGIVFLNPRGIAKENGRPNTAGETAKWVSEYGSVTFNLAGREFVWGGMNEAGLAMSSMELMVSGLPGPDDERFPFDSGFLIQYVLDTCGDVDEAVRAFSLVRLVDDGDSPGHFLIADAAGNCAAIEYLDGELACHTGEGLPIRAMANATYGASVAFAQRGVLPQFNPGESVERVAAAAARMEAFRADLGVSPVDYSLGILTETVVAPRKWWSDLFGEPYTRWSIVFDLARQEVHFRTVDSPRVRHLALGSFDLSCTAPWMMLDVNAKLEGNVEAAFVPYDHERNLEAFREFCDRWGIEVSKEDAVGLMRFFESFECAEMES